jgi:hypothetical protein
MGRGRTTTGMVCAYMFQYFHALHFGMKDILDEHDKIVAQRKQTCSNLNPVALRYIQGNYK